MTTSDIFQIDTTNDVNEIPFNEELKKMFQRDTNYNADMIGDNENITAWYIVWLQAQLYKIRQNN